MTTSSFNQYRYSFEEVAHAALAQVKTVLNHYLPGGKIQGDEYVVRNPKRQDNSPGSFSINMRTGKWADFAAQARGGDLISLVAYLSDCDQGKAAGDLIQFLGLSTRGGPHMQLTKPSQNQKSQSSAMKLVVPIPDDAPLPPETHSRCGKPSGKWKYTNRQGCTLFYVYRFEPFEPGGKKQILPLTLWQDDDGGFKWQWKSVPEPRPLYGLHQLAQNPNKKVIICEGEKATDAAQRLVPDAVCMTSANGADTAHKSDWYSLTGLDVFVWPDADHDGRSYAQNVVRLLQEAGVKSVKILDLDKLKRNGEEQLPNSFDAADFESEGRDIALLEASFEYAQIQNEQVNSGQELWPAPRPINVELKPVPVFDADTLLPKELRDWVMDEAGRMPCPPDFIAAPTVVILGSIIGTRCAIKPKRNDNWVIIPNLWGGIVGEPTSKKTPAANVALGSMEKLIAQAEQVHQSQLSDYETAKMIFDSQTKGIESRIKKQSSSNKDVAIDIAKFTREIREHNSKAPQAPLLRRYKTNDTSIERLGEILRDNPNGVMVMRDELVGLLSSWNKEGHEGDRTFYLEGWNGNQSFDTDRIGRGHIHVPNLCISLLGGIQPDKLITYLEQAEYSLANDGMLQRFQVLVYPDPYKWDWRDRAPNKAARNVVLSIFKELANFSPTDYGASPACEDTKFSYFSFSEEAQEIFIKYSYDLHCTRLPQEDEPLINQHLGKYDKLFPALALVFHLVDCAANGTRGPISCDAALRAAAWCEYLEAHARRCYGLLKDDGLRATQALASKLEKGELENSFTLRDVRRHQWRALTEDKNIQAALDWLEDLYWIRGELVGGTRPGSGRPTIKYRINPIIIKKNKKGGNNGELA